MKSIHSTVFNDVSASLINLLETLSVRITRATLRKTLLGFDTYPNLTLRNIVEALVSWDLSPRVFRGDAAALSRLEAPVLVHISCNGGLSGIFVVLHQVQADRVTYFTPAGHKLVTEDTGAFLKKWSGIIIALDGEAMGGEADYERAKGEESRSINAYRDSVQIIENYLSPEDCDYIIRYCTQHGLFKRSQVNLLNQTDEVVAEVRNSSSAAVAVAGDAVLKTVLQKASALTNMPVDNIEALQCVRYGQHEHYGIHFDADAETPRVYTVLVYLNDDFVGGETWFPEIGMKIKPRRGSAILFPNLDAHNEPLLYSAHSGMPVVEGTKFAMNVWVNQHPIV